MRVLRVTVCCDVMLTVGSLVMRHPGEMSTPTQGSILFGTVNGAIGKSVIAHLCKPQSVSAESFVVSRVASSQMCFSVLI